MGTHNGSEKTTERSPGSGEAPAARIAATVKQEHGGRRYGGELKREVVEYAFARQGERATIREIAEERGLSAGLLGK